MREAAAKLMARDQKGRDFFVRGLPEDVDARAPRALYSDASGPDAGLCAAFAPRKISAPM